MENQNYPIWKHSILYGVYLSVILIVLSFIYYILELQGEKWTGYINYIIILGGIVLASVSYKRKYLGGFMTYGQSFSAGFLTGLFSAIIMGVFTYIFISFLGEKYIEMILEKAEEAMLQAMPEMSNEELDMAMDMSSKMMTPLWLSISVFFGSVLFGLIFALVASIFIKKEDKSLEVIE